MKNLLKKNQLMITALAIMIAVAGYLQFTGAKLGKEDYIPTSGTADLSNVEAENYSLDDLLNPEIVADDGITLPDIESLDSDANVIADDYLNEDMDVISPVEPEAAVNGDIAVNPEAVVEPEDGEIPGEAVFTGTSSVAVLSEAKLMKEQLRAKSKETLQNIIDSTNLSDEEKKNAVDTMVQMTLIAEQEMNAEILLEAKGFPDVVVSISDDSADVVVNTTELTDAQRAQIEDIMKRKTNVAAENIIISTVVK